MSSDRETIRRRRSELRREYKVIYQEITLILFEEDPIGINFKTNTEEYEPEAGTILPRLRECGTADDVRRVVHDEFVRWFGADIAGSAEGYTSPAKKIWAAFQNQQRG